MSKKERMKEIEAELDAKMVSISGLDWRNGKHALKRIKQAVKKMYANEANGNCMKYTGKK